MNSIIITAPARICLFGDHQDYLSLPVIACAIDRHIVLTAKPNNEEVFNIEMPDIMAKRQIPINSNFDPLPSQDYYLSSLVVLQRYGCIPNRGFNIRLESDIPINAGVSSSSAVVVAWVHFLLKAFGCDHPITPQLIAQIAYEAEVLEYNSPGGRMDQYTISIGDLLYVDTSTDTTFEKIGNSLDGLILAESGIPKETLGTLSEIRALATKAIDSVSKHFPDFDLKTAKANDYERLSFQLSEKLKPYFYAAIKNHSITVEAYTVLKNRPINLRKVGQLMYEHHYVLRNSLKITVPKIDAMIAAAISAGAYGAKIVGSGGGGSIAVLAPKNMEDEVIAAILRTGAKAAYKVNVSEGTKFN